MKTISITAITLMFALNTYATNIKKEKVQVQDLKIEYTKTDVSCFGKTDGKIEIDVTGGILPYIIVWDNGLSSLELNDLRSGDYSVKVCDARGKETIAFIKIESPSPLQLSMNSNQETFIDGLSGAMNAKITGGTPWDIENTDFYFIRLNDQANFDNPTALKDGEYEFSVEDANKCVLVKRVNIDFSLLSSKNENSALKSSSNMTIQITILDNQLYMPTQDLNTASM
jgi:hypothetical protein